MKTFASIFMTFIAISGIFFGELFEQIVFVPNWLLGDLGKNVEAFSAFKHSADPGMYYLPLTIIVIIGYYLLLSKKSLLSIEQKKNVRRSLFSFLIVLALTSYVIITINIPAFDEQSLKGESLKSAIELWSFFNVFRILLPAYSMYQLIKLLKLES